MRKNRNIVIGIILIIAVIVGFLVMRDFVIPMFAQPVQTGVPTVPSLRDRLTQTAAAAPTKSSYNPGIQPVVYMPDPNNGSVFQETELYESCKQMIGVTATPTAAETAAATTEPTISPTIEATQAANPSAEEDFHFFRIVGSESEACYQVGEIFLDESSYNLAVGSTKSIDGEIAIDMNNVANSQIGEIVINISEFKSDRPQRDGIIRRRWLESNNFPLARLTNARAVGLPQGAYTEGETLKFQVVGDLTIREVTRETTFDATGKLENGMLVVVAVANTLMTDFGFDPPFIAQQVRANNELRIVLNLVAREDGADSTSGS
jgi:polyisoprenoid-binding protein YceI